MPEIARRKAPAARTDAWLLLTDAILSVRLPTDYVPSSTLPQHPLSPTAAEALRLLGGLIEEGRIRKGWTRESLAERLGVGVVTLRRLVRGEPGVAAGTYFEAAALLDIPLFEPEVVQDPRERLAQGLRRQRERLRLLPSRVRRQGDDTLPDDF